jgi:hypothetical protein
MVAALLKGGFRLEEIESLTEAEQLAFFVAFGEQDGGVWDWDSCGWRQPER